MFWQRKNYDSKWFTFSLGKEEIDQVEDIVVTRGLRTLLKINQVASKNQIKLTDQDKSALMTFAALTYESFVSDFIETKLKAERDAEATKNPPEAK